MPETESNDEPNRGGEPKGGLAALRDLAAVGVVLALVGAAVLVWARRQDGPTRGVRASREAAPGGSVQAAFVGDQACAGCHPGEAAYHRRSGHSRALRRATESRAAKLLDGESFPDEEDADVLWSFALRDGALTTRRAAGGRVESWVIDYAFGSGRHATTFVSLTGRAASHPVALEHRLTYFAKDGSFGTTPGQTKGSPVDPEEIKESGRELGTEKTLECFGCHTTLLSANGQGELDPATMVANISCERCHGPGRDHVSAARLGAEDLRMPFGSGSGSGSNSAELQMRLCGQCHRHPDMAPAGSIEPDNLEIVRFQPVGLMQSKCYTRSRGALSCTTCHDPHARVSNDRAAYESVCLSCHSAPPKTVCGASRSTGCVSCHMPELDSGQKVLFHDHWIRVRPPGPGPP